GNDAPARIACQRARKIGVRRSSSTQSVSSLLAGGSSCVAIVAAIRNLAGRRFSATSRYHDSAPRTAGSSQIVSVAKSLTGRLLRFIYAPAPPTYISTRGAGAAAGSAAFHPSRRLAGGRETAQTIRSPDDWRTRQHCPVLGMLTVDRRATFIPEHSANLS